MRMCNFTLTPSLVLRPQAGVGQYCPCNPESGSAGLVPTVWALVSETAPIGSRRITEDDG